MPVDRGCLRPSRNCVGDFHAKLDGLCRDGRWLFGAHEFEGARANDEEPLRDVWNRSATSPSETLGTPYRPAGRKWQVSAMGCIGVLP